MDYDLNVNEQSKLSDNFFLFVRIREFFRVKRAGPIEEDLVDRRVVSFTVASKEL